jgi:hypothetical protein
MAIISHVSTAPEDVSISHVLSRMHLVPLLLSYLMELVPLTTNDNSLRTFDLS